MNIQKSFSSASERGALYIVGTPIGNLEDMSFRAIKTLQEASLIAAEDTRQTRKLLTHFDIQTPLHSYHEHNKMQSATYLLERLRQGEMIALVSDAGMPAISDPGYDLVAAALEEGISVIPIPGPNAALSALVCAGLPTDRFMFIGFLPRMKKQRIAELERLSTITATLILYESPHRLDKFLVDVLEVFDNRRVAIARELTKRFEEFFRGSLTEAIAWIEEHAPRGEFCIIIEGFSGIAEEEEAWWEKLTVEDHVERLVGTGLSQKDAIKQVAVERNVQKREVYQAVHVKNHHHD